LISSFSQKAAQVLPVAMAAQQPEQETQRA
jgi:hypothetical protein